MATTLEHLLTLRARRLKHRRTERIAKRPDQPYAAELAYKRDLRSLVKTWGSAVRRRILHLDDDYTASPNDFVVFNDILSRLTQDDVILPMIGDQAARINAFTSKQLARSMGIDPALLAADRGVPTLLSDFREQNLSLIRSLSKSYVTRVGDTLSEMEGARVEDVAAALEEDLGVTESHADLIAVDQTLKYNSQLTELRQSQIGVTEYVWMTAHDERVRPAHAALDGTRHGWSDEPPVVDPKTGRREHPGRDFRCRCQAIAVIPGFN